MSSKEVAVRLTANTSQYQASMKQAGASTTGLATTTDQTTSAVGSKWKTTGSGIASTMGLSYAAVGVAAVGAAAYAVGAASNLEESINAVGVAFGEAGDDVLALGEDSVESFGLSQRAFNEAAVGFSSFAEDIAGAEGDVAGTLEDLMGRATDMASVFNVSVPDAAEAMRSALSGEAEPMKRFGIVMTEAKVNAYALSAGIINVGETMTDSEKQAARYGFIMQETADVQGDWANTSDGFAGSMKKLKGEMENLAAAAGTVLIPVLASLAGWAAEAAGNIQAFFENDTVEYWLNTFKDIPSTVSDAWDALNKPLVGPQEATGAIGDLGVAVDEYGGRVRLANDAAAEWVVAQKEAESAAILVATATTGLGATYLEVYEAMKTATEAADGLREANRQLADGTYSLYDAEAALMDAFFAGETILADSEASFFEVRGAMADVALAADDVVTKQLELDGVVLDSAAGQREWTERMLISAATLAGPMQNEVLAHIARVNGIPQEKITEILADADPNNLAQVEREIDAVANKSRTATINIRPGPIPQANYGSSGWITGFNAAGTDNWRGGLTWVGEQGPELMNLPQGTQIFSHNESVAMMTPAAQSAPAGAAPSQQTDPVAWGRQAADAYAARLQRNARAA